MSYRPSACKVSSCHPILHSAQLTIQSESVAKHPIQRPLWGLEHSWEGGIEDAWDAQGGGREDRESGMPSPRACRPQWSGPPWPCGGLWEKNHEIYSTAPSFPHHHLPSKQKLPYPKAAQPHPPHPTAPRGSAPAVPGSGCSLCGPGGPAAGTGAVLGPDPERMPPTTTRP